MMNSQEADMKCSKQSNNQYRREMRASHDTMRTGSQWEMKETERGHVVSGTRIDDGRGKRANRCYILDPG